MGGSQPRRMALHRPRQTYAERLHRKFQRPAARRIVERDAVHVTGPGPRRSRVLAVDYTDTRPRRRLEWKTPSEFAFTCHPRRHLALRLPPLKRANPTA